MSLIKVVTKHLVRGSLICISLLTSKDTNGKTAFHLAWENGNSKIIELFLQNCANVDFGLKAKFGNGCTVFHWACSNGHLRIVEILIQKFSEFINLYSKDGDGKTGFHWACKNGQLTIVEILKTSCHTVISASMFHSCQPDVLNFPPEIFSSI